MLAQMTTVRGNLAMVEMDKGSAQVLHASLYRHAGDHDAGNEDSWSVQVKARIVDEGNTVEDLFSLKSHMQHGIVKAAAASLAAMILCKGEIDLRLWNACNRPR